MEEGEETNQLTKEEGKVRTELSSQQLEKKVRDVMKKQKEKKMKIYRLKKSCIITASLCMLKLLSNKIYQKSAN